VTRLVASTSVTWRVHADRDVTDVTDVATPRTEAAFD